MRTLQINAAPVTGVAVNRLERKELRDKTYAVAPVVALKPGVLNGELVTTEAIDPADWNGRPVPIYHPRNAAGEYVSANSPDVAAVGTVYNARLVEGDLVAELWIDEALVAALGGDSFQALERLDRGDLVEVSTAYFRDYVSEAGVHGGKAYEGIARNLRADHVALLPREIGACSIADGCGAGRGPTVNCQCHNEENHMENETAGVQPENTAPVTNTASTEAPAPQEQAEAPAPQEQATAPAPQEQPLAVNANLAALAQAMTDLGGAEAVIAALRQVTGQAAQEKQAIVGRLAANARAGFTAQELGALPVDVLRKLDRALTPGDYSGQAPGPLATNAEWVVYEAPKAK